MKIELSNFEFTECWDGVLYKKLSDYPNITDWEIQTVIDFINYEKIYGRTCQLEGDENVISKIEQALKNLGQKRIPVPEIIKECTACPTYKGCMTDFVCHTSPVENAIEILKCGSLLSPVKARKQSAETLQKESRNAAKDPADYFDYIMFSWGNCQAGDRLVMERKLGRFPDENDLSKSFTPGVRFFFKYNKLVQHPDVVFEGVLPFKVKNEVVLKDWVHAIIVPLAEKTKIETAVPDYLKEKLFYIEHDCKDIWAWSEKVYEFAKRIGK